MKKTLILCASAPVRNTIALVYLVLITCISLASQDKLEAPIAETPPSSVVIYATRFEEPVENSLPQTFIITDREIQKSGLSNVSEVLQKIGGLTVRQNLDGSTNGVIDIRGFGDAADNNVLVLLDGVRLSENEQASARTSLIPLEAIDHIEITRGGSSVLYGDGATGGVINIVTKTKLNDLTVVTAGVGSYSNLQSNVFHSRKNENFNLTFFGKQVDGGGYRDNSGARERSVGFSATNHLSGSSSVGIRATVSNERDKLPGALPISYLDKNPKLSQVAGYDSTTRVNTSNVTLHGNINLKSDLQFYVDLSHATKSNAWNYSYDASTVYPGYNISGQSPYSKGFINNPSHTNSFSPRFKYSNFITARGELIAGYDWREYKKSVYSNKTSSSSYSYYGVYNVYEGSTGTQIFGSKALYARASLPLSEFDSLVVGVRRQNYHQDSTTYYFDSTNTGNFTSPFTASGISSAYEIQYNKTLSNSVKIYFRDSRNFRFANLDDNASYLNLLPQTSKDFEAGATYQDGFLKSTMSVYYSRLTNEIGFDGTSNVNFDPTRRQGLEATNRYLINTRLSLLGAVNISESKFSNGQYSGKSVPGASDLTGSIGAQYKFNSNEQVGWQTRFSSYAYASSDMNNIQARRAGYGVSDLNYVYSEKQWQLIGSINNVFNKNFADTAIFKSAYYSLYQLTVYPALGRNFSLTGRYSF
jgi:iron complex outermembrane receptor protein